MNQKKTMDELQRIEAAEYSNFHGRQYVVVLDNIRSAYNVGSIFRTADAMGVGLVVRCGITPDISHREVQKTALGAELSVPSEYYKTTQEALKILKSTHTILAIEQVKGSKMLQEYTFQQNQNYAIVLGNEVEGVSEESISLSNMCLEIPQLGSKHSLNVSNSASIVLWEMVKPRLRAY